jgi:hypothetical protein
MKRISALSLVLSALTPGVLCLTASMTLPGCASLERSSASGYGGRSLNESRDDGRDEADREKQNNPVKAALMKAEKTLEGKREREQYFKNKPYMRNDGDRLDFLALDSFESRQRWLNSKGISPTSNRFSNEHQYLIDTNDITLGMTKQAVRESWGEPELVEVAGNPMYGNERWHYTEQASSTEGYQTQRRMVYFDAGRVSGWESH